MILKHCPFPVPMEMINDWGHIIRNNSFYYVEGVEPGNVICIDKHSMITKIFREQGYKVTYNDKGSNLIEGITTALINDSTIV